jgi:predicted nucleic-acid-binding protein
MNEILKKQREMEKEATKTRINTLLVDSKIKDENSLN